MPKEKSVLYIPKVFLERIIAHAAQEYPEECCGILAGKAGRISKVYPMKNIERSSQAFFMDPEEQYQVFQEMEREKLELLGIYHSHPHSPAYPSSKDIDLAFYPDVIMVIISLYSHQNPWVGAFKTSEKEVKKIKLKII